MADDRCDLLCLDLEKAERLRHERLDIDRAARFAEQARALSDPTRLIVAAALARRGRAVRLRPRLGRRARREPRLAPRPRAARAGAGREPARRQDGALPADRPRPRAAGGRARRGGQGVSLELPMLAAPPAPEPQIDEATYRRLARRVRTLSWLSLAWMAVEGGVAIAAGIVAGSIALVGFGLDSAIEGFASLIIVWRFTGQRMFSATAETRAQKLVAIQFFLLAPYVAIESVRSLVGDERPEHSWVGIGLAISSVILMPALGIAKQRLADQLGSAATKGEGRQNMLCAYLAGALLLGLLGNVLWGAWWLDPIVGLADRRAGRQGGPRGVERGGVLRLRPARRLRARPRRVDEPERPLSSARRPRSRQRARAAGAHRALRR